RKFAGYSKGMKRKLTIAAGIIHSPAILFLDEPTTGIDVASARQVRKLVADLNEQGTTILLTTHYIEEAERLCHRVAFIVSGRIVREDSVDNLVSTVKDRHVVQISMDTPAESRSDSLVADLASSFPAFEFSLSGPGTIRVEAAEPIGVGPLIRLLEDRGALVLEARRLRPSLEDVFVAVTGLEAGALAGEKEKPGGKKA
ncbi:MAG: ABC transporter ATP-binding protein, partial [Deltaproteobacteria bacterium]|nr:ABC transporter ATP-binding protein [Deltaproteobacteria bacterium]